MIPNKKVVYLPIDVEEDEYPFSTKIVNKEQEGYFFTEDELNEYTANVIKVALDAAVANVGFVETTSEKLNAEGYKSFVTADDGTIFTIDSDAISVQFDETFKKFKI